ncbi:MAG: type 1 glutamine amidotransferase domain-containing protein [Burkholderiaceae bacterium]
MANELQGKRVAMLMTDGVEIAEYTGPRQFLEQHGAQAELISPKPQGEKIQGFNHITPGQQFTVEKNVKDADPAAYDLLVLPGGAVNADQMRMSQESIDFIRRYGQTQKPMAVICHAPWELINAGLAQGKRMTSWPTVQTDLRNAGADWVDETVVVDGCLITSRKPADIPNFNDAILKMMTRRTAGQSSGQSQKSGF